MRASNGKLNSYKQVKSIVISNLNLFLIGTSQTFLGFGLQIDFSKRETVPYCSGLLTDNGVIGMLDAADLYKVDQVLPFLDAIVDVICGTKSLLV